MKRFVFVGVMLCLSNVAYADLFGSLVSQVQQQVQNEDRESKIHKIQAKQAYDSALNFSGNGRGIVILDKAIDAFNEAIKLNPDYGRDAEFLTYRGNTYEQMGNLPQAMADFNSAIAVNPNFSKAYYERSITYNHQGNLTQAMSDISIDIQLDPNNADAYNKRGTYYGQQGNLTQAMADYNKAIELNPQHGNAYSNRAVLFNNAKDYVKAWTDVQKAEQLGIVIQPEFRKVLESAYLHQTVVPFHCKYDEFNWGDSLGGTKAKLLFKAKIFNEVNSVVVMGRGPMTGKFLVYDDALFQNKVKVILGFSLKTEKLCLVAIVFPTMTDLELQGINQSLNKYGPPVHSADGESSWGGRIPEEDTLQVSTLSLNYFSGQYEHLMTEEANDTNNSIMSQDAGKL